MFEYNKDLKFIHDQKYIFGKKLNKILFWIGIIWLPIPLKIILLVLNRLIMKDSVLKLLENGAIPVSYKSVKITKKINDKLPVGMEKFADELTYEEAENKISEDLEPVKKIIIDDEENLKILLKDGLISEEEYLDAIKNL